MNFPERASAAALLVSLLTLWPGAAAALGLGHPSTRAVLGEPLRLSVQVRLEPGEQVTDECLSAEVYFGDEKVGRTAVSAAVLPAAAGVPNAAQASTRTLLVRTTALVNEPVVTVYLSAGCQARITRKFVALADPPSDRITSAQAVASSDVALLDGDGGAQGSAASAQASALSATAAATSRSTRAARAARAKSADGHSSRSALAHVGASSASGEPGPSPAQPGRKQAHLKAPAAVATAVSRLQIDPVEADALVSPELRATVAMSPDQAASAQTDGPEVQARRDAAAALWRALNATPEQQLREQQRLQALEKRLGQLHAEGEQTRQSVSVLQARMRQIEADRPSGFWTYVLGGLALAAMGAALYLHAQLRRQERQRAAWWPPHSGAVPLSVPREGVPDTASPPEPQGASATFVHASPVMPAPSATTEVASPTSVSGVLASAPPAATSAGSPVAAMAAAARADWGAAQPSFAPPLDEAGPTEPLRAVSVEELIDLEQQAEFFVVLGQDEAAIGLLEAHVQGTEGTIPLPFLKLLELYQRLGRRDDYERVQAAFNAHFNGHAPTWEADLQQGHSLAEYPGIIERLQALWSAPTRAMDVLEKSLIRPDAQTETFDLPAYRELLFLYAVARDLADKPHTTFDAPITAVTPLTATRPFIADPDVRPTLEVDLRLDELDGVSAPAPTTVRASAGLPTPAASTRGATSASDAARSTEPGSDYRP